jgi:hypothetical protein
MSATQSESSNGGAASPDSKEDALTRFKRVFGIARPNPVTTVVLKQTQQTNSSQTLVTKHSLLAFNEMRFEASCVFILL